MSQNEKVKEEVKRLQEIIDTLTSEEQLLIIRGQRPERISYSDFKVLNRVFNQNIKKYLKGSIPKKHVMSPNVE